jgi:hypothetical protein
MVRIADLSRVGGATSRVACSQAFVCAAFVALCHGMSESTLHYCTAPSYENYCVSRCVFLAAPNVTAFRVDRRQCFRGAWTVPFYLQALLLLCCSSLEPHRRLGLILHQNVPLSPEAWVHLHDATGDPGVAAVHLCRRVLYVSLPLCGLFSTL